MTLRASHFFRTGTSILVACVLSACAAAPVQPPTPEAGEQVATHDSGTVRVQLPARWNLCKAEPIGDVQSLRPDDRVHVAGTVTEAGIVVVCEQPQHHLRKVE
jgi:hypothetical protein